MFFYASHYRQRPGRNLKTLDGLETRPTTQKTKKRFSALFSLTSRVEVYSTFFAGSGQLGIEAMSRGGKNAVFVDSSKRAVSVIKENIALAGFEQNSAVLPRMETFVASCREKFGIIFLDPPYKKGILKDALPAVCPLLETGGIVLCEHDASDEMPPLPEYMSLFRQKNTEELP